MKKSKAKIRFMVLEKGKSPKVLEYSETKTRKILLSTGLKDVNGREIWEGDRIQHPTYNSMSGVKRRMKMAQGIVCYIPGSSKGKVMSGEPINDPPRFYMDTTVEGYRFSNWGDFFMAEVISP